MITDDEEELNGDEVGQTKPENTDKDLYVRFRRNFVTRNLEHVGIELACDAPRIVNLITSMYRTSLGKLDNVEARQERVGISERGEDAGNKRTVLIKFSQKALMDEKLR